MTRDLKELVERLESASGADRELDAEVHAFVHGGYIEASQNHTDPHDVIWHQDNGIKRAYISGFEYRDRTVLCRADRAPAYTSSLDAAMSLVPEGRSRRVEYLPAASWPYRVWLFKDARMPLEENSGHPVLGKTEPLALCIAALKALSQEQQR